MDHLRKAARKAEATSLVRLPLVCMADRTQMGMNTAIGQLRSPFQGLANWPWLDEALAADRYALAVPLSKLSVAAARAARDPVALKAAIESRLNLMAIEQEAAE